MPADRIVRRLAAILSADVVGYSRLMADDEQATVDTITAYRGEILHLVGEHGGRVVDAIGDNVLAEFPAALDAVEAAVEIQNLLKARNETLPEQRRMRFRVGIHMGDVRVEGDRIYGDGVNIAARLEALAEPGGICLSAAVWEQVRSKLDVSFADLGEQSIKGLPAPVRVYRMQEAGTSASAASSARPDRPSIVVLPFANMSADPDQEYFCDGMAEEVINALTQLEGLHVVARTSAFSFKGRNVDVREIGAQLGVRSVLEGSVRTAGDRLRVTAQLVKVDDGYHLWSERFDRQLDDVFAIQDEIAARIVGTLKVKLLGGDSEPKSSRTDDQEAYDLYLRGMHHRWLQTEADLRRAADCFEQTMVLDPGFAGAYAGAALVYSMLGAYGYLSHAEALEKGKSAALRAVELDPQSGLSHDALGFLRGWLERDWKGAERSMLRAVALNPGDASARLHYANSFLNPVGRTREGLAEIRRAHELDPVSPVINRFVGEGLFYERQFPAAVQQLRHTLAMAPKLPMTRRYLASAYVALDRPDDALRERQEILRSAGYETEALALAEAFSTGGEPAMLSRAIEMSLSSAEEIDGDTAWDLTSWHARLGEIDEGLKWLSEAVRLRSYEAMCARAHPSLDGLRAAPEFRAILKTMNLE